MISIAMVGMLVMLAQAPPGSGGAVRYKVTLEYRGVWGTLTEGSSGTCPGVPPGFDKLTGIVEGVEPPLVFNQPIGASPIPPCTAIPCPGAAGGNDDDAADDPVQYTGVLTRTTNIGLCEVKQTSAGDEWCAGHLNGGGSFKVTITVPAQGNDNEEARVVLQPEGAMTAYATVSGACTTLDNGELAADCRSGDAIQFETSGDGSSGSVFPTGRLAVGSFKQTTRSAPSGVEGQYTMKVERADATPAQGRPTP